MDNKPAQRLARISGQAMPALFAEPVSPWAFSQLKLFFAWSNLPTGPRMARGLLAQSLFTCITLPTFSKKSVPLHLGIYLQNPSLAQGKMMPVAGELHLDPKAFPRGSAQHF